MTLVQGAKIGPYEILSALGAGGMGEVYKAKDARLERVVALKVLPEEFFEDKDRRARFEREAKLLAALNHPNVAAIFAFEEIPASSGSPARHLISMELLEGETLRSALAAGPFAPEKALDCAQQMTQGLAAAHEKGIIHRDLKPENVFLTRDGRVKLLDFGVAKLTRAEPSTGPETHAPTLTAATEAGVLMGTVGYISPEQLVGRPADQRSDIFAFGAILYEMLKGRRAFEGDSAIETMHAILKEEPPALSTVEAVLPTALERVVRRCLQKNPEQRFQSARDMGFALTELEKAPGSRSAPFLWAAAGVGLAVGLVALVIGLRAGGGRGGQPRVTGRRIDSLAVLPLQNLSRDPEQEYFSDGMTEELITNLARIGALRVISRTSVMSYKGTKKPLAAIARELNVDAVVEGSVMRSGEKVRITAQLIQGSAERHLWAESYQRDLRDVLSLQTEVARAITREIAAKLTSSEDASLANVHWIDPGAHEAYLKGRYSLNKQTEAGIRRAIEYFREAIDKDPLSARAYSGLADAYATLRLVYVAPREVMPQARAAAEKAVALDGALAEGHNSLGQVKLFYDFDWTGAESEFRKALELNPNLADAHDGYALYLVAVGRLEEAIAEIRKAERLDPLSLQILSDAGWVYYMSRKYDEVIEVGRKAVELDPGSWVSRFTLGVGYEKKGRFAEAVAELEKARQLDDNSTILEMLAGAYVAWGKKEEGRKVLDTLTRRAGKRYVCAYEVATIYVGLEEKDAAFRWLEKAVEDRADCVPWMKHDSKLDPIRTDPRYLDLIRRVGFPQ